MIFDKNFSYAFDESACEKCGGKCCIGQSGNIFVSEEELKALKKHLGLKSEEFAQKYLKKVGSRMSFKEFSFEDGFACIFFDTQKRICSIYDFRPQQCKTFPFWEYFKRHEEEVKKECIGICYLS